jgi:hypothetical protein
VLLVDRATNAEHLEPASTIANPVAMATLER